MNEEQQEGQFDNESRKVEWNQALFDPRGNTEQLELNIE